MSFYAFGKRWSIWVPLAAIGLLIVFCLLAVGIAWLLSPPAARGVLPTAVISVIPAPTSTPAALATGQVTPAPTSGSLIVGGIGVGMFVQITGTEGDGLRLRSGPGTDAAPRFLGREAEVFQVKDGPVDASGYTWWYLVAPYDENRSGWAAANFLAVVAGPTPGAETPQP